MATHKEISIHYHPQDGTEWAKYLQSKLGEREYQIGIGLNDVTSNDISQGKSKINVFLITPDFLELIDPNIIKGFDHKCSLSVLMGVGTEDFTLITKEHGVHEDVKDWITLIVDASEESVRHLLMTIVTLYDNDYPPPKIQMIFKEVIGEGMNVYIGLEKKAESDVSVHFDGNDEELKATYTDRYFYTFSLTDEEAQMFSTFNVRCKKNIIGEGQLRDIVPSTQQVNPTAGHVYCNIGEKQTKLQQLRILLENEIHPINLLCQCMGLCVSETEQLDRKLANKISALDFPEHLSFISSHEDPPEIQFDRRWPTLLHFAAEYDLVNFAEALLLYPALQVACQIRNRDGHTPDELAHHSGHLELSEMLRMFSHFILNVRRFSNDSGFGDKVRLSQIKSYIEERESFESSQMCLPPPTPHVGYVRPPKPRPVQVVQMQSVEATAVGPDRRADDISTNREVKEEDTEKNVKDEVYDSEEIMCRLEETTEPHIKLQTESVAAEEIVFIAHPEAFQEPTLRMESNAAAENIPRHQRINMREEIKPVAKKRGFFYKLLRRKEKPRKCVAMEPFLPPVDEFQIRDSDIRMSMRLSHAMRDKNITYPTLPSKKPSRP
ncbi:hypothetical protein CHS0354_019835 [Potamilus streckersoni]|uniref:DBB domain-containing protein n=1 Tax=Potamilus streckersoni TaxID=2493646 RepID=A0AAE0W3Z6_9BIVA|nr:hypothetical protein CHS0354_019835 [Potamilus streckersoni]